MKVTRCSQDQVHAAVAQAKKGCCCGWSRVFAVEVEMKIEGKVEKIVHRIAMNFFERIWTAFVKLFGVDRIKNKFNKCPVKFLKEVPKPLASDQSTQSDSSKKTNKNQDTQSLEASQVPLPSKKTEEIEADLSQEREEDRPLLHETIQTPPEPEATEQAPTPLRTAQTIGFTATLNSVEMSLGEPKAPKWIGYNTETDEEKVMESFFTENQIERLVEVNSDQMKDVIDAANQIEATLIDTIDQGRYFDPLQERISANYRYYNPDDLTHFSDFRKITDRNIPWKAAIYLVITGKVQWLGRHRQNYRDKPFVFGLNSCPKIPASAMTAAKLTARFSDTSISLNAIFVDDKDLEDI